MERLSILVAGRNTRPFLELCLRSIRGNFARKDHRLLVLDDASTDGSAEWVEANRSKYGYDLELHKGPERLGIVGAYNRLAAAADTPAVWMVHTDMYFAPGADEETARYLAPATVCTCTRVEPPLFPPAPFKIVADLGFNPDDFQENEFLKLSAARAEPGRFTEGIFAPVMCYREDFLAVGGLDPAFAPQSREDSDLFNRMALAGYRFRQSRSAFCYHFGGRGSRKKAALGQDSPEWQATNRKNERNFIRRWGMSVREDEHLKPIVPAKEPLALVALLGNEPENVIPFLENLEPFFDEIVFVADGPQPESVAKIDDYVQREEAAGPTLLRRGKFKVVERPLAGEFSAQRNFGQEQCSSEWVLHVDLDERFDRVLLESLQDIVKEMRRGGKSVCGFPRLNYLDGVLANDLPRGEWTPEGLRRSAGRTAGQLRNLDPQFRLVRNGTPWHHKVHETPEPVGRDLGRTMFWPRGAIRHAKTVSRQKRQDEKYESMAPGASLNPGMGRGPQAAGSSGPKILMLATEYPPARAYGLGRYASELSAALARCGADVHVVNLNRSGGEASFRSGGVAVHELADADHPAHYEWISGAVFNNLWLLERAEEVVRDHGPFDVLLAHDWLGALAAKGLRAMHGLPLVLFMHDTEPGRRNNKLTREQLYIAEVETWTCTHADVVVANSQPLARELERFHKVPKERLAVVPCGVNPANFETDCHLPDFRALFCRPEEKLVLFAGRLSPTKGPDVLIRAAPAILKKQPGARFVLAGEGVMLADLQSSARELGVADRAMFVGHLAGKVLGAMYRAADLVVVPSRYEPFGMVALEAMSCGTPVAGAAVGGLRELLGGDGPCWRFAPGDPKSLAATVAKALANEATEAGREKLRNRAAGHTWDKAAAAVLEVCRRAMASRQAVRA
jgi:glycosyltransferase involved in cell wall biosynthesis/GT2 family glycosyltransferase